MATLRAVSRNFETSEGTEIDLKKLGISREALGNGQAIPNGMDRTELLRFLLDPEKLKDKFTPLVAKLNKGDLQSVEAGRAILELLTTAKEVARLKP